MAQPWFKADLEFNCPSCNQKSTEIILARARDSNAATIAIVQRIELVCHHCKVVCRDRVEVQLSIKDFTPEELASLQTESRVM